MRFGDLEAVRVRLWAEALKPEAPPKRPEAIPEAARTLPSVSRLRCEPRLLRVDEVAERLGMKPSTIRRWVLFGKIAVVRPNGRAVRITEDEIMRLSR